MHVGRSRFASGTGRWSVELFHRRTMAHQSSVPLLGPVNDSVKPLRLHPLSAMNARRSAERRYHWGARGRVQLERAAWPGPPEPGAAPRWRASARAPRSAVGSAAARNDRPQRSVCSRLRDWSRHSAVCDAGRHLLSHWWALSGGAALVWQCWLGPCRARLRVLRWRGRQVRAQVGAGAGGVRRGADGGQLQVLDQRHLHPG